MQVAPTHHDRAPVGVQGRFTMDLYRHGFVVERIDEPNLVVIGASRILALLLGGAVGAGLTQLGVGTDMTLPAYGNTGLVQPYLRPLGAADTTVPGKATFAFQLDAGEANGLAIGEFGLFSAAGVLFARKTRLFELIHKDASVSLTGTWTIDFTGA